MPLPPQAQRQRGWDRSRSSCPTNDPYNSAPSLQQLSLSGRITTSSASARAEGCARRARRGVPGFSPRDTPARACRCAFLITGAFCDPAVNQARPESGSAVSNRPDQSTRRSSSMLRALS